MTNPAADLSRLEQQLGGHPFFERLEADHLRRLAECAMLLSFVPGEVILREGDLANRFYLILEGRVALETELKDGSNKIIETINAGEVLGWSWLLPPFYWNFTARAIEATRAIFFYGTRLREECEADHEFGYELMKRTAGVVVRRLQSARRRLIEEA